MITAFVLINCAQGASADVAQTLVDLDSVSEIYSVTGDHDLIAIVRVADFDRVADVIATTIATTANVVATRTHIAFRAYSRLDLEAMFDIGNP